MDKETEILDLFPCLGAGDLQQLGFTLGAAVFSLSVSPTCLAHAAAIKIDEFLFLKTLKSDRNERYEAYITLKCYTKGS